LYKGMTNESPIIALKRNSLLKIIKGSVVLWPLLAMSVLPKPVLSIRDTTNGVAIESNRTVESRPHLGRPNELRTVVIDPGHGGKDPGCMTSRNRESRIVLKIALQLAKKIKTENPEVRVILTRATDHFVDLAERANIANRNRADLFISIHVNAHPKSKTLNGTETYTLGLHRTDDNLDVARRENSVILKEENYEQKYKGFNPNSPLAHIMLANYQHAFMASSINFAEKVERSFKRNADRRSHGVKQAGFVVLWRTTMPSVLVETGFLTNAAEEKYLASADGQAEISTAIYKAFAQYKSDIETVE
jgi:N-acetylmuramoyl-L-alanine amidase